MAFVHPNHSQQAAWDVSGSCNLNLVYLLPWLIHIAINTNARIFSIIRLSRQMAVTGQRDTHVPEVFLFRFIPILRRFPTSDIYYTKLITRTFMITPKCIITYDKLGIPSVRKTEESKVLNTRQHVS